MVVLAASICTRSGRVILSRQFKDLHKDEVLSLLASFPKLTQAGTQHTTVEDENVRYVYQPLEELYVVLITNRQSNILQDIDTLRLFTQVVSSNVRSVDEREILSSAYELLSAFDEIIALGYRENLSLGQIRTILEMESHEEKIQEIIERNKELEAAEERKRKAKQLEIQRREASKRGGMGGPNASGFGNTPGSASPSYGGQATSRIGTPPAVPKVESSYDYDDGSRGSKKHSKPARGKGLQLGSKKKPLGGFNQDSEDSPLMSLPAPELRESRSRVESSNSHAEQQSARDDNEGIRLNVTERISAILRRDGSVKSSLVKGSVQLSIGDPELGKLKFITSIGSAPYNVLYQTNPNIDKQQFNKERVLALRDASKSFPTDNQEVEIMRWKITGTAEDNTLLPISFNCWVSRSNDNTYGITIEYEANGELDEVLENVVVSIPMLSANFQVSPDTPATCTQYGDRLEWLIPQVNPKDDTASGSVEFTAEADEEDDFFPMEVSFRVNESQSNYGKVDIADVVSASNESNSLPFEKALVLEADNFTIE